MQEEMSTVRKKEKKMQKKVLYKWFTGTISFATCLISAICWFHGDAFSFSKIKPTRDFSFQATANLSHKELESLRLITSQPFTYLTEGPESYVFISQDQKHVIKFFKMRRMTPKYWLNYIPLPWLDKKRLNKVDERERVRNECFRGLKIAFDQFKYQTGILFMHLFRTQYLKMNITVCDRWGKSHLIPLDQIPFLIQRRVVMLPEYIDQLMSEGKQELVIHRLCQLLELVKSGCQQGFVPASEEIDIDYGFIEDRPIYVEAIYSTQDPSLQTNQRILKHLFSFSKVVQSWLYHHYPLLVSAFQEEVQDVLRCIDED